MPTLGGAQTAPSAEGLDAAGDDKGEDFDPFVESLAKGHVPGEVSRVSYCSPTAKKM